MSDHAENLRLAVKGYAGNGNEIGLAALAGSLGWDPMKLYRFTSRSQGYEPKWGEACEILKHCPPEVAAMALKGVGHVPVIRPDLTHADPFRLMGDIQTYASRLVMFASDGKFCHRERAEIPTLQGQLLTAAAMYRDGSAAGAG